MRSKQIWSVCLALCLLLCCLPAAAAGQMGLELYLPDKLPAVGGSFTVTVAVQDNPGLCAIQFSLAFDAALARCTEISADAALSQMMVSTNADTAALTAVGLSPVRGDVSLARFRFTVLASGDPGFALQDVTLGDINGDRVSCAVHIHAPGETPPVSTAPPVSSAPPTAPPVTPPQTTAPFPDVPATHWAGSSIARAVELGLVSGYEDGLFRPGSPVTRSQFITMLWRLAGKPKAAKSSGFKDVSPSAWYGEAVAWAAAEGLASGVGGKRFDPEGYVTREQAMTILFRYSGAKSGPERFLRAEYESRYQDAAAVSAWAKDGVYWSVYNGIVSGKTNTTLVPGGAATRAETVTILLRYADKFGGTP